MLQCTDARDVFPFYFGWRQRTGVYQPARPQCPSDAFPTNMSANRCDGLHKTSAQDAVSCEADCCFEYTCSTWQFKDPSDPVGAKGGCWIGTPSTCNTPGKDWTGG